MALGWHYLESYVYIQTAIYDRNPASFPLLQWLEQWLEPPADYVRYLESFDAAQLCSNMFSS